MQGAPKAESRARETIKPMAATSRSNVDFSLRWQISANDITKLNLFVFVMCLESCLQLGITHIVTLETYDNFIVIENIKF